MKKVTVAEIRAVQVNPICTPELIRAVEGEATAIFEAFLQTPGDAEVLKDILSLGDAEMFTTGIVLHMTGTGMPSRAEMEAAATRLHAMFHRGVYLVERFGKISDDEYLLASALKSVIVISLRVIEDAQAEFLMKMTPSES